MTEPLVGQMNFEGLVVVGLFEADVVGALLGVGVEAVFGATLAVVLDEAPVAELAEFIFFEN
jgi:hypothetical protein